MASVNANQIEEGNDYMTKFILEKESVVAGIDLGGTNTEVGLIDSEGRCLEKSVLSTQNYKRPELLTKAVANIITDMTGASPTSLKGIGIGAPNGNYYTGCIEHAPNLAWKGILPVAEMMSAEISVPVAVTNDANAAAVGEMIYGKAKGMKHFISITMGTGLGSGIVLNGKVLYGHTGFAGEMGHTTAIPGGRPCSCGKRGCLESYASARGLVQTTRELLESQANNSPLSELAPEELTPHLIHEAGLKGDPIAIAAFNQLGDVLGKSISDAVAYLSPEAVFLFGGLTRAGDLVMKPTQESMDRNLLPIFKGRVKLELSQLNEANAAILGAGALIWNKIHEQ